MFAGQDKDEDGNQNYSSYVELNYPFRVKMVDLTATCGFLPYTSYGVYTGGEDEQRICCYQRCAERKYRYKVQRFILFAYLRRLFGIPVWKMHIWSLAFHQDRGNLKQATHGQRTERTTLFRFVEKIPPRKFQDIHRHDCRWGKTYRMLQEAHELLRSGIDVQVGYVETHGRVETEALVEGLPLIPRRRSFYKGKEVEEMDLQAILNIHPEVVIVDELAHTNIEGSKNEKRWQDVTDILEAGISVITAVNIQHLEGLNEDAGYHRHRDKGTHPRQCPGAGGRGGEYRPDSRRTGETPESRKNIQAGKRFRRR